MEIALCHDENYAPYGSVVMSSVMGHNPSVDITFHILHTDLSSEKCLVIKYWVESHPNKSVKFYRMRKENFADFPIDEHTYLDYGAYIRLFLGECLADIDKVLYLDCDIIVNGSLDSLWDTDINGYAVAGVRDRINDYIRVYNRLQYPLSDGYINSGVMLINLKKWRDDSFFDKAKTAAKMSPKILMNHDQDLINMIYHGQIKMLPFKYNLLEYYLYTEDWLYMDRKYYAEIIEACKSPTIIHFCMPQKPWHYECINPYKELYYKYRAMTPWQEVKLTHKVQRLSNKQKLKLFMEKIGLYKVERKTTLRKDINIIEEPDNVLF